MDFDVKLQKLALLTPLKQVCVECHMCELGFRKVNRNGRNLDPHVFSTMTVSRFMVIGQNPGYNEVLQKAPFVGDAGKVFDDEIAKHGLTRQDFYISNAVKCFTEGNTRPQQLHIDRCEPILRIEIQTLKPKLVVSLGGVAFEQLCPGRQFSESLGRITKSAKFGVPVFPIYHPSPLNLDEGGKRGVFEEQIRLMCGLVQRLKA